MKRLIVLSLALVMLFCSCQKKQDDGFDLIEFSKNAKLSILDASSYDVLPYERDNADVESLITAINAIEPTDVSAIEYVDYKDDTPSVTIYLDEGDYVIIFRVWSMGEGECAVTEQVVGSTQVIYTLSFKSESIAALTEKIYNDFLRG